jgi:hypothetical protein
MGNVCHDDVMRAELYNVTKFKVIPYSIQNMHTPDQQETLTSWTQRSNLAQPLAKTLAKLPQHGPSPTDGYYVEMPML